MNLILFTAAEALRPLPREDPRAVHLLEVLRRQPGDSFDAGLVNGPRGRGTLVAEEGGALTLAFAWGPPPPPPDAVTLILGLPRPQTARDILREATTLGVSALHFVRTGRSEAGYARSSLWREDAWRRHLLAGAAQAFATQVPEVTHDLSLAGALAALPAGGTRLALDNYEAAAPLASHPIPREQPAVLAFGPERGWTAEDRDRLRAGGFTLVHLGTRVLRLETAVVAALTLVKSARGSL
ncbi:MAG: RsmE family RNA methyltransferase [Opitutales bacterium]